ncbi:penicillin-binding protein 1C [Fusobacterium nucleatum]|uniref:penicillin-binding protein 1C n=1 Tax=Fusobacterium nucleatum TaxID=851 RepID=UPI0023600E8C|nr:penicillin-binding protein 1C [Fusobacterium nucleatum]WDA46554.1 penicillin-binding protein 1C [Fusobacterium nucleatum]
MLKNINFKKVIIFFITLFILLFIYLIKVYITYAPKKLVEEINYSKVVLDRKGEILSVFLNSEEEFHIKYDGEVPETLKTAVINYEDKKFYSHSGVDYPRILKSFFNNMTGRKKMGASTISMQVVKLLEPKKRTYFNKLVEVVKAYKLESEFSKEEILKIYLNNVPYGSNIVGYSGAIKMYFNKEVKDLSYAEATLLAVLPNSPGILNLKKNNDKLEAKRNRLLKTLLDRKLIDERQYKFSLLEKFPNKIYYYEKKAPQFSIFLKNKYPEKIIKSTLDYNLQKKLEKIVHDYSNAMKDVGINNAAVLVVNNKTKEVLAYVASQDFYDKRNNGEIDGLQAKRSPASLLKPFLFALSIDDGLIVPDSIYPDVPIYFGNFYPKNSSNTFTGMVKIEEALIKSLNIPFVKLLSDYGVDRFYYFLENNDNYPEDRFDKYGLSLILGTREMRPVDIGKLYIGLANYGKVSNLKYTLTEDKPKEYQQFSRGASYLTLETLSRVVRPGNEKLYSEQRPISWKTGTSYGMKDAWSVGVSPDYTVLVWLGNFNQKSIFSLSGVETAGNLLFKVFNIVDINSKTFEKPTDDLKEIEIDEKTGYRKFYDVESKKVFYPKDAKLLRISPYYKKIFVDENDMEIDSRSPNFDKRKEKIVIEYPIEVSNYFFLNGVRENKNVKIAYPVQNLNIFVPKDFDGYKKVAMKLYNPNNEYVYWYLDEDYVGYSNEKEKFFELDIGKHKLTIITENGAREEVKFNINKR